eukprot:GEMP01003261.1.p1 GENE.GEMP01003261.1~~GEMP01003261.1.p1  ORF type:complete len:861 (+),score=178.03 GEMP01003261.1:340-2922(+)
MEEQEQSVLPSSTSSRNSDTPTSVETAYSISKEHYVPSMGATGASSQKENTTPSFKVWNSGSTAASGNFSRWGEPSISQLHKRLSDVSASEEASIPSHPPRASWLDVVDVNEPDLVHCSFGVPRTSETSWLTMPMPDDEVEVPVLPASPIVHMKVGRRENEEMEAAILKGHMLFPPTEDLSRADILHAPPIRSPLSVSVQADHACGSTSALLTGAAAQERKDVARVDGSANLPLPVRNNDVHPLCGTGVEEQMISAHEVARDSSDAKKEPSENTIKQAIPICSAKKMDTFVDKGSQQTQNKGGTEENGVSKGFRQTKTTGGDEEEIVSTLTSCEVPQSAIWARAEEDGTRGDATQDGRNESQNFKLHQAVWLGQSLDEFGADDVNVVDHHGHCALELAIMLFPRNIAIYLRIVKQLLEIQADPVHKGPRGWKVLDEAVTIGDRELLTLLYNAKEKLNSDRWTKRMACASHALTSMPDFKCEVTWCIESSVPLLGYFAPSDTVKLWKRNACLRLDSTVASWSPFRGIKRRKLSIIFNPNASPPLSVVNHSKKQSVDPSESLCQEEVEIVVNDLVASDPVKWDILFTDQSFSFKESTSIFGNKQSTTISSYSAVKMDLKGCVDLKVWRKGLHPFYYATFEQYFGFPLPPKAVPPEIMENYCESMNSDERAHVTRFRRSSQCAPDDDDVIDGEYDNSHQIQAPRAMQLQPRMGDVGPEPRVVETHIIDLRSPMKVSKKTFDMVATMNHRPHLTIWLCDSFPISLEDFMPILDLISHDNDALQKARRIIRSPVFDRIYRDDDFPVKLRLPVNFLASASVTFSEFMITKVDQSVFHVPAYPTVARSEAQNLKSHKKRRLVIANMI